MKKIIAIVGVSLLIGSLALPVAASNAVKLMVNGKQSPVKAIMVDGTTYVPVRFISEKFGASVDYKNGTVSINQKGISSTALPDSKLDIPLKGIGERVEVNNIAYSVFAITYISKNGENYAQITFQEELKQNSQKFGKLPDFVVTANNKTFKLVDFSTTVHNYGSSSPNNDNRRTFTYTFPLEGEISTVYYYPGGFDTTKTPIGEWQK